MKRLGTGAGGKVWGALLSRPNSPRPGSANELVGRWPERQRLAQLLDGVRGGASQALVLRGAPGIGKSALLDHLVAQAAGFRVLRIGGVQAERELAFAGLHQLCAGLLDRVEELPAPQRNALHTAFGLADGPAPTALMIGLAVLNLMSGAAEERPLLCVVDDCHWLDRASTQALGFVARRLLADRVGMVFAVREPSRELAGLPELGLDGLDDRSARTLLDSVLLGPLDGQVRDQIVAEMDGNPLALLESLSGAPSFRLAGGFGLPGAVALSDRIEEGFRRRLDELPDTTRALLGLAAADPTGNAALVWRAAGQLGIERQAAGPAVDAGLVGFGARVWFRHPLLRSAVYGALPLPERRRIHLALMAATDPALDPDRRAWHRAQATFSPDEAVAAELERSAERAGARGGPAAAAAFLKRAGELSVDPTVRIDRLLAAAQATVQSGSYAAALELLRTTDARELNHVHQARVDLLRGTIAFAAGLNSTAPRLLMTAAGQFEALDLDVARETYLSAWMAAAFAGGGPGTPGNLSDVCVAARRLPASARPGRIEQILDALSLQVVEGRAAAADRLRTVLRDCAEPTAAETLRWGWYVHSAAMALWDFDSWRTLLERQVAVLRSAGAHDLLPILLSSLATVTAWSGDLPAAQSLVTEVDMICEATNANASGYVPVYLACLRGDESAATRLIEASVGTGAASGAASFATYSYWAAAVLHNGLGRHRDALTAATRSLESGPFLYMADWALAELVEAAARCRETEQAAGALQQLEAAIPPEGTDVGRGLLARSRALLAAEDEAAEPLYVEAVDRFRRTGLRPEMARSHLVYGEWLRRRHRRSEARAELRTAHEMSADMGMAAFAERARRELLATGERAQRRTEEAPDALTAQELLIATLAAGGLSNPEIGAQLFLSARTVEWHLHKVFAKLGVATRRELASALP